jgi:hypothetical protein
MLLLWEQGPPHLIVLDQLVSIVAVEIRKARLSYNFQEVSSTPPA